MEEKTAYNDVYEIQNLFIPVMHIAENNWSMNVQTFFLMEKVFVNLPHVGTKEIILIYDSGSGTSIGNKIESLDHLKVPKFTDLVLSSLNGYDKTKKRVCEINVRQKNWESCSFDVICPQDKIPTPQPQSMNTFCKVRSNRYKNYWVNDITEYDLNTLPVILLGLSDIKFFPIPTENIPKKVITDFPHIQFYESRITGRKLAAGVTISSSQYMSDFPRKPTNIIWNYQKIHPDQIIELNHQPKETVIQVNYNLNTETKESTVGVNDELILESNEECQFLSDIINNHDSDEESKRLIESIITRDQEEHSGTDEATICLVKQQQQKDKEEHAGIDNATICLVQQLQRDSENEVKQEEPEPFKFHEDEFPPLK